MRKIKAYVLVLFKLSLKWNDSFHSDGNGYTKQSHAILINYCSLGIWIVGVFPYLKEDEVSEKWQKWEWESLRFFRKKGVGGVCKTTKLETCKATKLANSAQRGIKSLPSYLIPYFLKLPLFWSLVYLLVNYSFPRRLLFPQSKWLSFTTIIYW